MGSDKTNGEHASNGAHHGASNGASNGAHTGLRASSHAAGDASRWSDKRIFTTGEAAEVCKVSQQTVIRCFDSGRLGGFRVPGSKFRRIPRADLIKFMRENDIPTDILEKTGKRVLIVDDDPAIIEMFKDVLSKEPGYTLQVAATGYDAGLLTESFRPHLIILDYMLPDINGNVICKRLRERDEFKDTKIMFVSGVVAPDEVQQLRDAGANDFLAKPFDINDLKRRVVALLSA